MLGRGENGRSSIKIEGGDGGIDSESVPPYYICSNWFFKNKVFGYTTQKLACCKRRGYLTLKRDYLTRLKPSLKVLYNLVHSNKPSLKNINFAFKIVMKDGFDTQQKLKKVEFIDNLIFLLKSKGYHAWIFKGLD